MKTLVAILLLGLCSAFAQSGATAYGQCQGCHQPTGAGIPGAFPALAGHVNDILKVKGGREHLIRVVLYGIQGQMMAGGKSYSGAMPGFAQLSDVNVAAVLNHISTSWGNKNPKPYTAAEVKAQRPTKMTPAQVLAARKKLGLK